MSELVIEEKPCGLLVPRAVVNFDRYFSTGRARQAKVLNSDVERLRFQYRGRWVGGAGTLTTQHLTFTRNKLNRAMRKSDYSFSIPLVVIPHLDYRFGFIPGIIRITTNPGVRKLRCYGAKRFFSRIARESEKARASLANPHAWPSARAHHPPLPWRGPRRPCHRRLTR
jgi:hypothetical protein